MGYTLTQSRYRTLKSNLTRAVNSGDYDRIIKTCNDALAEFERDGYPDDWSRWERARDDAEFKRRFA